MGFEVFCCLGFLRLYSLLKLWIKAEIWFELVEFDMVGQYFF